MMRRLGLVLALAFALVAPALAHESCGRRLPGTTYDPAGAAGEDYRIRLEAEYRALRAEGRHDAALRLADRLLDFPDRFGVPVYRCGDGCEALHTTWNRGLHQGGAPTCIHGHVDCSACDLTAAAYGDYAARLERGSRCAHRDCCRCDHRHDCDRFCHAACGSFETFAPRPLEGHRFCPACEHACDRSACDCRCHGHKR